MEDDDYDLEFEKVMLEIERAHAQRVLIQLPDGLKPRADELQRAIKERFPEIRLVFWSGSCYGACDAPLHVRELGFDLLLQFGHAAWRV